MTLGDDTSRILLPHERLALNLYRFVESAGIGNWRPTALPDLWTLTKTDNALIVDEIKRLHAKQFFGIRKYFETVKKFVEYGSETETDEEFFYRRGFELKVLPDGRPWFEQLEQREARLLKEQPLSGNPSVARPDQQPLLRVFLCHSSGDKTAVRDLDRRLRHDGFDTWLDETKLIAGQDWNQEIRKAVRSSHIVAVCLSASSVTKEGYVQKEIKFALDAADEKPEGMIFIIPARLEDCPLPERLSHLQCVDLFRSTGYENLIRALRKRLENINNSPRPLRTEAVVRNGPDSGLPDLRPKLVPVRYGTAPGGMGEALYMENDGTPAFDVKVAPIHVGPWTITFSEVERIKATAHASAWISKGSEGCTALDAPWRESWDAMGKPPGVPMSMVYRDFDGTWYESVCALDRDVLNRETGFAVRFLRQRTISAPTMPSASN